MNSDEKWPAYSFATAFSGVIAGLFSALLWKIASLRQPDAGYNAAAAGFSGVAVAFGMAAINFPDKMDYLGHIMKSITITSSVSIGFMLTLAIGIDEFRRLLREI